MCGTDGIKGVLGMNLRPRISPSRTTSLTRLWLPDNAAHEQKGIVHSCKWQPSDRSLMADGGTGQLSTQHNSIQSQNLASADRVGELLDPAKDFIVPFDLFHFFGIGD